MVTRGGVAGGGSLLLVAFGLGLKGGGGLFGRGIWDGDGSDDVLVMEGGGGIGCGGEVGAGGV